jgi:hypothetical protein
LIYPHLATVQGIFNQTKSAANATHRAKDMKTEFLLYGTKQGEPSYMETLLAELLYTAEDIEKVKNAAKQNGFAKFRIAEFKGGKPNFIKAINC